MESTTSPVGCDGYSGSRVKLVREPRPRRRLQTTCPLSDGKAISMPWRQEKGSELDMR